VLVADDAKRVNHARNDAQNREEDVDEEVLAAATIEENGDRRKKDREEDLATHAQTVAHAHREIVVW